ncbi:nitrogen fixation protein [Calothrix sp. NIES-4071]|nr:nitrogen fixation protein [Calothrix sp. NIES-4071]BAZ57014.1 nitrogen fixation protein [Calothrix sp. NIES-4105]
MSTQNVSEFLTAVKNDEQLRQKLKDAVDLDGYTYVAQDRGYNFTTEELRIEISKMSEQEVAEIVNPGITSWGHIESQ